MSLHSSALMRPSLWAPKFPQLTRKSLKNTVRMVEPPSRFPGNSTYHSGINAVLRPEEYHRVTPAFLFYTLLWFASTLFGKSGD